MQVSRQSTPVQKPINGGRGYARFKSACDACLMAKLNCDEQKPCKRCRMNNISCSYSPTKRHGKQQSWGNRVAVQHQRYLQSTLYGYSAHSPTNMALFPERGIPQSLVSPVTPTSNMMDFPMGDPSVHNPPLLHSFNANDTIPFDNPWPDFTAPTVSSPASTTLTNSDADTPKLALEPLPSPMHDCEAKAMSLLQSLHRSSASEAETTLIRDLTTDASIPVSLPPLDELLYANRVAVSSVRELLACPCAHQPHLASMYLTIISKALFWYRIAANLSFKSSAIQTSCQPMQVQIPTQALDQSPIEPSPTNSASPGLFTGTAKMGTIQIGAFNLEEEDEALLVRSIVTSEVRKIGRLVDTMKVGESQPNAEAKNSEARVQCSWYMIGCGLLDAEVKDTIRIVGQGKAATDC